jgi:CBS domain-containing protein
MQRELTICHPSTLADEAVRRAAEQNVQEIVVVDDAGYAVGLVSRFDLLLAYQSRGRTTPALTVSDVMETRLVTCTPETPIPEVVRIMIRNRAHRLLVAQPADAGMIPLGIISVSDIIRHSLNSQRTVGQPA